jgi:NitT/TauT family transport system substrate-binding protein
MVACGALALLLTATAGGAQRIMAAGAAIKIAAPPFYSSALAFVATELHFWQREGLNVTLMPFNSGPQVNEALLGGSVDFGMGVGIGPAIALAARNGKIVVVASEAYGTSAVPAHLLMVRKDSPYTTPAQLDGKKIAVQAKGSISYILLEAVAQKFKIHPVVLEVPAISLAQALSHGEIDAVETEIPFPQVIMTQGGKNIYGLPNDDVAPVLQYTVTLTTRRLADTNPQEVVAVTRVILRTARWLMDNPDQARLIITNRLNYSSEIANMINPRAYAWSRNGYFVMSSVKWWGEQMRSLQIIDREPEYGAYFVRTFADQAVAGVGKVADPEFAKANAVKLH